MQIKPSLASSSNELLKNMNLAKQNHNFKESKYLEVNKFNNNNNNSLYFRGLHIYLNLCMPGNLSSANFFRNTIRVSNNLDPDQDRHSVGLDLDQNGDPDMDPNC